MPAQVLDWDLSRPQEQRGHLAWLLPPAGQAGQDQGLTEIQREARRAEQKPKAVCGLRKCVKTGFCCLSHGSRVLGGAKGTASAVGPSTSPPTSWVTQGKWPSCLRVLFEFNGDTTAAACSGDCEDSGAQCRG